MSRISDIQGRVQSDHEVALGSPTLTIGATSYLCVPSLLRRGNLLVIGGKEATVALTLLVRRDVLATSPALGSKLTHGGVTYRVLHVSTAPGGSHWELDLMTPDA